MASKNKNLDTFPKPVPQPLADYSIGIAVSEWNKEITDALYEAAIALLLEAGIKKEQIHTIKVPGAFELPLAAKHLLKNHFADGVVCIGCIIKGETPHFDFIANAVTNGILQVGLEHERPTVFGVLTPLNIEQAKARAGGEHGNKGKEAAYTLLHMLNMMEDQTF